MPGSAPADTGGVTRMPRARREDVLAGALRHEPVGIEHDRLVVTRFQGFDLGERRVHVVASRLRQRRHRVVVVARPARDLHADALGDRVGAEVRAPWPARDRDLDLARQRVQPHLAVAVVRDRPDVARRQPGGAHGVLRRLHQLVDGVRDLHHHDGGRVEEARDVLGQPEDGRALLGLVGADPFEDARAVVQRVRQYVNLRLGPRHELAVHPDLLGRRDGHRGAFPRAGRQQAAAIASPICVVVPSTSSVVSKAF